jgi:multidrug efflux pump subunit AcrA (membrane-fusion protein)
MGTVLQVTAREGDDVQRGQVLAQLDERELSARRSAAQAGSRGANAGVVQATKAVAAAQAQADVIRKTYDRYNYLKEQKSVSPQEFDEVAAKQEAAQANLEQAKAALSQSEAGAAQAESEAHAAESVASYARVVAPFDGRVIRRSVEPGSLVSPGMPLFVVEDTSRYQLEATLPAEALEAVKKNALVRVQFDALPAKSLTGKVAEIEAGADPTSHTLKARVDLPKESGVQSGMFGRAYFAKGEKRALVLPTEALVSRGQLHGIFVVHGGGLIHWRVVTPGNITGNQVEVLSGLSEGEVVVLNPGTQELDGKKTGAVPTPGENHS